MQSRPERRSAEGRLFVRANELLGPQKVLSQTRGETMKTIQGFINRADAGAKLADCLRSYIGSKNTLVLALPRGGVPVGIEVARKLRVPMDALIVRKLGVPSQPELAMGAVAAGGVRVLNNDILRVMGIDHHTLQHATEVAEREVQRRNQVFRGNRPLANVFHMTVILVDDGLATGATMRSAVQLVRQMGASRVIVAVPVGSPEVVRQFQLIADEVYCLLTPTPFYAIGNWYADFRQLDDIEVQEMLEHAESFHSGHNNMAIRASS